MTTMTATASTEPVVLSSRGGLPRTDVPNDFAQMMQLAEQLASAEAFLPEKLQGNAGNVLAVMLRARALDIPLAVAWDELFVHKGKVGQTARLVRALARRAGHRIAYVEHDRFHAVALIQLADESTPHEVRFTMQEAIAMGLTQPSERTGRGGEQYDRQPENMMVARVTTRAVNRYCPEVMLGMGLGQGEDDNGDDVVPMDSDTVSAVRQEHREKVVEVLRTAEDTEGTTSGELRLRLLRTLFIEAREDGALDYAADDTGEYSVRQVIVEKMKVADALGRAQADGQVAPGAEGEPETLEELRALMREQRAEAAAAKAEAEKEPEGEKRPARKRAPRKTAAKKAAKDAERPAEETAGDGAAPAAPKKRAAPRRTAKKAAAPTPPPVATQGSDAATPGDPAGRAADRAGGRDVSAEEEDGRSLPCGCLVDDVIRTGVHGDQCKDRPSD